MDLAAPPFEQRVIDHHRDRRTRGQQPLDDQPRYDQPQPVDIPYAVEKNRHAA